MDYGQFRSDLGETSSIEGHISVAQEKIRKFSNFLEHADYSKKDRGVDGVERKLKKKLKKEMKKWKSQEEKILKKIFELKNDMKVQLTKIERERDRSRTRNIRKKKSSVKKSIKICGKCSKNLKFKIFEDIQRRQPSFPIGLESAEKLKKQRRRRIKEKYSDSSSEAYLNHNESTSSVENLELDSIYSSKKFLGSPNRRNQIEMRQEGYDNWKGEEESSFEISQYQNKRATVPYNINKREARTPENAAPCKSENLIRCLPNQNSSDEGDITVAYPKSKTYDFDNQIFKNLNKRIAKLTGENESEYDYSVSNIDSDLIKEKTDSDIKAYINASRSQHTDSKEPRITVEKKPMAFEISFDMKKMNKNLTLKEAFQANKPNLRYKIDANKRMKREKMISTGNKFHNVVDKRIYRRDYSEKKRESKENKRDSVNQRGNLAYDLTSDEVYKKFIKQKKMEQNQISMQIEKRRESPVKTTCLEIYLPRERSQNYFKNSSRKWKKRKKSVPRVRDPSQKLRLMKNYDNKIRKRNRKILSKRPQSRSRTPVTNPRELIKDYQNTLMAIKNELESFY